MRQHSAAFANFICRFGDKVLLDYAEQIVIPAFTKDTYVRSYGKRTHYHFYEVELLNMAEDGADPIIVLAGSLHQRYRADPNPDFRCSQRACSG